MMDADCVFNVIKCVPKFRDLLKKLTHQDAMHAVAEVFNILHSAPGPEKNVYLTPVGCLVVTLLQQVLVRFFIKKLMNIMTTEAVILHHNKIPHSYLENYLSNQTHFSLKDTITRYHTAVKANATIL